MVYVLASTGLALWGQVAAIILGLSLFLSIIVGLALAAALMFGFAWIREKVELLRRLRPQIRQINQALTAAKRGDPLSREMADNKIISAVVQVPRVVENVAARASSIEQGVDHGSTRVANAVIEFHARTAMVKGMARAFFLPGLTKVRPALPVVQIVKQPQQVREPEQTVVREPEQAVVARSSVEERPLEQEIVITQSYR